MKRRTFLRGAVAATALGGSSLAALEKALAAAEPLGPLLSPWVGPHGGIPPFRTVKATDIKPGLMKGMDLLRAEIKTLAATTTTPDFESTIARFEDSGRPLGQAQSFFNIYTSTMNDKAMKAVEKEMTPILAALNDEIIQNEPLFKRIKTVYQARESSGLNPEQQRLTQVHYTRFERQGANLDKAQKTQLAALNKRLASLYTTFSQNQLADEEDQTMVLESEADLAGLSDDLRAGAAAAAEAHGQKGSGSSPTRAPRWSHSSPSPRAATCARRRGGCGRVAVTIPTRTTTRPPSPRSFSCAPSAPSCWAIRAMLTGSWPTTWPRRPKPPWRSWRRCGRRPWRARSRGSRRHAEARRLRRRQDHDRAVGLPLLRGEGAQGEIRHRSGRGEAVPAARQDSRGHVLGGRPGLRPGVREGRRRSGLSLGHERLRGAARRRPRRALVFRSLRAGRQELGRMDERVPHAGALQGPDHADRVEQRQLHSREAGRSGARLVGRCRDHVPRVRSRLARTAVERHLSDAGRHQREARLRGVPEPGERALVPHRRGAEPVRAPSQDRPADAEAVGREDQEGQDLQPGLPGRSSTWPRRSTT